MKLKILVATAIALATASGANAAQSIVITGPSGVFEDDEVLAGAFTRTFNFTTPTGFNTATFDISSIAASPSTNLDFTSVLFNGITFNTVSTGTQELRNLFNQSLVAGANNTIVVNGTSGGNAAFSGNIAFAQVTAAVPEPGTWAMMLLGFGAMGVSMRRRRRTGTGLLQVA
jgi:hypothetical protein